MSAPPATLSRRHVAAAVIGNALEFYDFVTYAFFAVQIGHAFFPTHNAYASLMLSLGTFGAGFAMRPLGGIVLGRYADKVGRKPAMLLSFALMGCAILAVAVIPSYAMIGITAPVLVVLARMVQGFALGGEVGSSTAFLMEAAPLYERGFYAAWQGGSQYIASFVGGIVGVVLTTAMDPTSFDTYGWRIAFALGALTLPFGLLVRKSLPETLHLSEDAHTVVQTGRTATLLRSNARAIALGLIGAAAVAGAEVGQPLLAFLQLTLDERRGADRIRGATLRAFVDEDRDQPVRHPLGADRLRVAVRHEERVEPARLVHLRHRVGHGDGDVVAHAREQALVGGAAKPLFLRDARQNARLVIDEHGDRVPFDGVGHRALKRNSPLHPSGGRGRGPRRRRGRVRRVPASAVESPTPDQVRGRLSPRPSPPRHGSWGAERG